MPAMAKWTAFARSKRASRRQWPRCFRIRNREDPEATSRRRNFSDNVSVSTQAPCPLCARLATLQAREDLWHVTCPHCFRFTLDPYLLDLFDSARQRMDVRVLDLLPRLSDAAGARSRKVAS